MEDDLWELLETLVREGKVRYVGVALGPGPEAVEAGLIALGKAPVAALQLSYNMLRLSPGRELFPAAADRDVGVVVRDPHAAGLLDDFSSQESDAQETADPRSQTDRSSLAQRLRDMQFLAEHHPEADLYELALAFCLAQQAVASALPEFRDLERVQLRGLTQNPLSEGLIACRRGRGRRSPVPGVPEAARGPVRDCSAECAAAGAIRQVGLTRPA